MAIRSATYWFSTGSSVDHPVESWLSFVGNPMHLYALAAREPGVQIENPRQVSAFHYPRADICRRELLAEIEGMAVGVAQ